jgi:hypothetical protein
MWSRVDPHARRGLTLALDRLEQARVANTESDWFVAAAEAIVWLMLADELNWTQPGYEAEILADPRGRRLPGFRYLWNLIKHYPIIAVTDFVPGTAFPMRFPVVWQETHWKARHDLPEVDPRYKASKRYPEQIAAYDDCLAGQLVKVTIPGAASFYDCRPSAYE